MMNTIETPLSTKPTQFKSYKTMRLVSTILAYVLLIALAIIWIYPLLWILISSFVSKQYLFISILSGVFFLFL